MPRQVQPLTDAKVKNAKPGEKPLKLFDGDGLFLLITTNGKKGWRFKYRIGGKEKLLSFGTYPDVSLSDAREKRSVARKQVAANVDPNDIRKAQKLSIGEKSENSFEVVSREWHRKFLHTWSDNHAKTTLARLENNVFPWLGSRPIGDITPPELLSVLRRVEDRGALETAHRIKSICGQIFRYAVATGRAERDPAADLKGALPPANKSHLAAITNPEKVKELLNAIDGFDGSFVVKSALKLAPLVFVRPGELRQAEWSEINLEIAEWSIPAARMKTKVSHLVPLSTQAIEILKELHERQGMGDTSFTVYDLPQDL